MFFLRLVGGWGRGMPPEFAAGRGVLHEATHKIP